MSHLENQEIIEEEDEEFSSSEQEASTGPSNSPHNDDINNPASPVPEKKNNLSPSDAKYTFPDEESLLCSLKSAQSQRYSASLMDALYNLSALSPKVRDVVGIIEWRDNELKEAIEKIEGEIRERRDKGRGGEV